MVITRDLLNTASADTASNIELGSCVTKIGNGAFSGFNITEIEFPENLQIIGNSAFTNCTSLTSIDMPNSVTSIGERAFQQCSGLTSIDIPSGVTSIASYAFLSCSGLKKITVNAATPPSLGSNVFNGSTCMIYVPFSSYDAYLSTYWSPYKDRITYEGAPYKVRFGGLDEEMFVTCNSSTTINASDVNTKYFSGTTSTTFGECVTAIGTSGFSSGGVKSLGDIVFSDSITSIGSYAFSRVSATSLSLNEGLETIGNGAFYYFNCNQPLELPSTITSIGANAFGYSTIPSLTINSDGTLELGANNLISGSSISAVTTNNVKVVNGLKGDNLRSITIHNAESIASSGFMYTTATDLVIDGSGETIINDSAFGTSDASVYLYADGSNIVNCTLGNCVTHIGKLAFAKSKIVNLTIPASVRSIGDKAFYTNYNVASQPLANVTFEEGSQLTSLGSNVFENSFNITNISLPNSITNMGSYVFDNCTGLTTANVPSNLTSIPNGTFYNCKSLSSVTVGNRITSIGSYAFSNCSGLTSINLPSSVTTIGSDAFSNCTSMNSFTIPSGVTSIGQSAFYNCSNLTTLIIPSSVLSIGNSAFSDCRKLTSIIINKDTPPAIGTSVFSNSTCLIYVPSNSYELYISAQNWSSYSDRIVAVGMNYKAMLIGSTSRVVPCNGNTTLALSEVGSNNAETINVGSCTSVIGDSAFTSSNNLQYISIPSGVTTIGDCAFYKRNGLTSVTIPDSVTSIGASAFYQCRSLRKITIGSGVTSIGASAFDYCEKLESITFNGETPPQFNGYSPLPSPYYDYRIYVPCNSVSAYVESFAAISSYISNLVNAIPPCDLPYKFVATYLDAPDKTVYCSSSTTLESSDFGYDSQKSKSGITSVIIGDCVTTIGIYAFQNCSSLTSIDIPSGVTSIGTYAFQNCSSFTSIDMPNSVTSIDSYAFENCRSLTSIDIPDSVTSIGYSAFLRCSGMTSCTLGSGVTSIGNSAFQYCNSLTSITVNATTPPTLGNTVFNNTNNCPIYVPCQSLGIYLSDGSWSSYKSRLQPIPPCDISYYKARILKNDGTTYDVNCDTSNRLDSSSITSKESVVAAEVGNCVSAITNCFNGCYNMSSVTFNEDSNIISIGDYTFQNCSGLTSINIPSSVTTIGYYAFRGCSSLSNITIPSNVNNIGSDVFSGCTNLKTITLEGTTPPTVNSNTFRGYNGSIYVPCESFNDYLANGNWTNYKNKLYPTQPCPSVSNKLAVTYLDATSFQIPCRSASETVASGDTISYSKPYSSMTSAEIGSCVTSIAGRAFSGYTSLSSVTFEQGSQVTSIGNYGFYNCNRLSYINLPSSITSIGIYAFYGCTALSSITIPNSVTSISQSAFSNCSGLTSITIGSGVTSIGQSAFSNCSGLTSCNIPSGVTTIGSYAFSNCTSLSSLTFAEGSQLTTIGNYAFRNCRSLRGDIVLPSGLTSIGQYAFTNCIYMDSITIPSGVTVFNDSILYGCVSLNSITIMATTPPELGVSSLDNTGNCPIYVLAEAVDTYKADITWGIYADRIEAIPNS